MAEERMVTDTSEGGLTISGPDLTGRRIVAAMFPDEHSAQEAARSLCAVGFVDERIGLLARGVEPGPVVETDTPTANASSAATEGGIIGGLVGAVIGLVGLAVPGIGWVAAGGALAATLAGAGVGAVGGGVYGALTSMGIGDTEARRLEDGVQTGRWIVTVNDPARFDEAVDILARAGGDLGPIRIADAVPSEPGSDDRASLM